MSTTADEADARVTSKSVQLAETCKEADSCIDVVGDG